MRLRLPDTVVLPTSPTARAGVVYAALGVSKQAMKWWRDRHHFPASDRRGHLDTGAVARWLTAAGVSVKWY